MLRPKHVGPQDPCSDNVPTPVPYPPPPGLEVTLQQGTNQGSAEMLLPLPFLACSSINQQPWRQARDRKAFVQRESRASDGKGEGKVTE